MFDKRQCLRVFSFSAGLLGVLVGSAALAATITVNSLTDPGAAGTFALRDAITAANTTTATNGCAAGTGNDTIQFSVTGTILLGGPLPGVIGTLTINGPASPGITISGGGKVQVMQVASGATLDLENLTIADGLGESQDGAGGIINQGTLTVTNSTFSNNSAGSNGGDGAGGFSNGVRFNSSSARATITNSTFSGNGALHGGGDILNGEGSTLTVTNSTLSGNDIANYGIASLNGTILAGCLPVGVFGNIAITDLGYNISPDNSCGFSATGSHNSTDPKLDPAGLRNNGGPTETIALLLGSPAIDAIPLDSCTDQTGNRLTADQRGFPRPDAGEQVCDIGAYEFQDSPPFAGQPGKPNCHGKSVSALAHQFGSLKAAATALGYPSVKTLQNAIHSFCKG